MSKIQTWINPKWYFWLQILMVLNPISGTFCHAQIIPEFIWIKVNSLRQGGNICSTMGQWWNILMWGSIVRTVDTPAPSTMRKQRRHRSWVLVCSVKISLLGIFHSTKMVNRLIPSPPDYKTVNSQTIVVTIPHTQLPFTEMNVITYNSDIWILFANLVPILKKGLVMILDTKEYPNTVTFMVLIVFWRGLMG